MNEKIRQVVENSRLFAGLEPGLIDDITASATVRKLNAHEMLFRKGDKADNLWGVLSGAIQLHTSSDDGKELVMGSYAPGDFFGEVGLLDFGPRRVDATAQSASELVRISGQDFLRYLERSPELCFRVFTFLCADLRQATESLEDTALYTLPGRLAKKLLTLAGNGNGERARSRRRATLNINQFELARMLGVHRQTVNRQLRDWERRGWLLLHRQKIELLDPAALSTEAAPGGTGSVDAPHLGWETHHHGSSFARSGVASTTEVPTGTRVVGILAVDAAEYSNLLLVDAAGTLQRLKAGLEAVEKAIGESGGRLVYHTGDRVLAEFPDAQRAYNAALAMKRAIDRTASPESKALPSMFRIGVHHGEVLATGNEFLGDAVNLVIGLTAFSDRGGIYLSDTAYNMLEKDRQIEFLGRHELRNVSQPVTVYSARPLPLLTKIQLKLRSVVPRRYRLPVIAITSLLLAVAIWYSGTQLRAPDSINRTPPLSLAVLPFSNGDDPDAELFAAGIAEEIRALLSRVPGMKIIGRESSLVFKNRPTSVAEIGRILDVAWIIQGRIQGPLDITRAEFQLVRTRTGETTWEQQFSDFQGNLAGVARDITRGITPFLGLPTELQLELPFLRPLSASPEANELYMRARTLHMRAMPAEVIKAVPLLQEAVMLDPQFAEAHAFLAKIYVTTPQLKERLQQSRGSLRQMAEEAIATAISINPNSAQVLAIASQIRQSEKDYEGARLLAEKALAVNADDIDALWARHNLYQLEGDIKNMSVIAERLAAVEPLSVQAVSVWWQALMGSERYDEALVAAERLLSLYPEEQILGVYAMASDARVMMGDRLGAIEVFRKGPPYGMPIDRWTGITPDPRTYEGVAPIWRVHALYYQGKYHEARKLMQNIYTDPVVNAEWLESLDYLVRLAALEVHENNIDEALEIYERIRQRDPSAQCPIYLDVFSLYTYRKAGRHDTAAEVAECIELNNTDRREIRLVVDKTTGLMSVYEEARFLAIEGRLVEAIEKLKTWREEGVIFTYISRDPLFENLRGNSEFEALVAGIEAELADVRARYYASQKSL
jgi:CRP-like cAMP-binding protein/TolB-like protein/Tfp pilus assembly protein PilF